MPTYRKLHAHTRTHAQTHTHTHTHTHTRTRTTSLQLLWKELNWKYCCYIEPFSDFCIV